mmetsp:Transcript_36557/g.84016  ORF Transcript_36557/g.84016 Transcript_36557/m.84016 type:complete len:231 (+) Transcript_36557:3175-3867(+)
MVCTSAPMTEGRMEVPTLSTSTSRLSSCCSVVSICLRCSSRVLSCRRSCSRLSGTKICKVLTLSSSFASRSSSSKSAAAAAELVPFTLLAPAIRTSGSPSLRGRFTVHSMSFIAASIACNFLAKLPISRSSSSSCCCKAGMVCMRRMICSCISPTQRRTCCCKASASTPSATLTCLTVLRSGMTSFCRASKAEKRSSSACRSCCSFATTFSNASCPLDKSWHKSCQWLCS